jgi:hypothetical protein
MFAAIDASGDVFDTVTWKAVEAVFLSLSHLQLPGQEFSLSHQAVDRVLLVIDKLDAVAARIGVSAESLLTEPHAYIDRFGGYKAPFQVAIRVAEHCSREFASDVLRYVKTEENKLHRAVVSGHFHPSHREKGRAETLREWAKQELSYQGPVFTLIRE